MNPFGFGKPPGAALLHCNRAIARCALGRYTEALKDIDEALSVAPNDAAFSARRDTVVRSLNRAVAFGRDADATMRHKAKFEDSASTAML